jgi:hypothetical protein
VQPRGDGPDWAIAKITTTKCYRGYGGEIYFVGHKQDVQMAHYLLDLFISCSESDWQTFRKIHKGDYRYQTNISGRKAFMRGLANRVAGRLKALREERDRQTATSSSNALVVLKGQLVQERYDVLKKELGLTARRTSRRDYSTDSGNYQAGQAAGSRINITTGIGGGPSKLIK